MSYKNAAELLRQCSESGKTLPAIILENEAAVSGRSEAEILASLDSRLGVMCASALKALDTPQRMPLGLISGQAALQHAYTDKSTLCGPMINKVMALALSSCETNASMGRICAAPTAGSCGILPAVLITIAGSNGCSDGKLREALLVASGFGAIIMKNATVSGAEGGCQAECGTAAAMAAAAAVWLHGGGAAKCAEAAGIALVNVMGLVCDPVAGLVQLPCSFRNASGAVNALISADMALAGQTTVVTLDEIIDAMYRTGKSLPPELRETAQGGIAATPTARRLSDELHARGL